MENLELVVVVIGIVCIWAGMLLYFFNKRREMKKRFNQRTGTLSQEKIKETSNRTSQTYLRREPIVNNYKTVNTNSCNHRHCNDDDDDFYRRPIVSDNGIATALIMEEIIDEVKPIINHSLNDLSYFKPEEKPLTETVSKYEENTFDYNKNSFSSAPIVEKDYQDTSSSNSNLPSSYSSRNSSDDDSSTKITSSYSSSSSYDTGSSSDYSSSSSCD